MARCQGLRRDERGAMAIEMAIIAPVLILLALGSADVSKMISREQELQAAVGQAEAIALAAGAATDPDNLKLVLMQSLSLSSSNVTVDKLYRCNSNQTLVSSSSSCGSSDVVSSYIKVSLTDSYRAVWQRVVGIGTWNYNVVRTVQLS